MQPIKDFLGKTNFILKAENHILKAGTRSNFESFNAHEFPKTFIFVLRVQPYSVNRVVIRYFNRSGKVDQQVVVPNDFQVKLVTEAIPTKIFDNYLLENMHKQLHRLGMTLGSDPEMFVEDENGIVIPAFKFLSSKAEGHTKTAEGNYGNLPLYWDGFQGEFETTVQTCLGWQTDSVHLGLKGLLIAARKFNPKAKISSKTVVDIPQEMLEKASEEHVQFGCMPSLNVYGMKGKLANGRETLFRPAGGHIHFGINAYKNDGVSYTSEDYIKMVKALDAILAVACVSLFAKQDDPKRRELYGLAGEYRLPKHGLEYRVLSNAWLTHPMIMNIVFDMARVVLTIGYKDYLKYWNTTEEETIKCINTCDVKLARKIISRNEKMFMQVIMSAYHFGTTNDAKLHKAIYKIFMKGMDSAVSDTTDISKNWDLEGKWITHGGSGNKNTNVCLREVAKGTKAA